MRGLPFNYQRKGTVLVLESQARGTGVEEKTGVFWSSSVQNRKKGVILEPRSVLDQRSPSPPTSTSTLSSPLGGGAARFTDTAGVAAVSGKPTFKWTNTAGEEGGRKEEWAPELHPVPASLEVDWDNMLSESAASPGQEQTFLHWIMGDIDDPAKQQHLMLSSPTSMAEIDSGSHGVGFGLIDPGFGFEPNASASAISSHPPPPQLDSAPGEKNPIFTASLPLSLPQAMFFQETTEEKPQFFGSNFLLNQFQQTQVPANPAFFVPLPSFSSSMENLVSTPHPGARSEIFLRPQPNQSLNFHQLHPVPYHLQHRPLKPKSLSAGDEAIAIQHQQQQVLVDQLLKTAELVEAGNLVGAHGILARLNHQLPSAIGEPFLRSAFYFKEALQLLVNSANPQAATSSPPHHHRTPFTSPLASPLDVVLKLSAYKAFSEVSPILQFTNFTATQALLEEIGAADCIHIIDFDIGVGGQWSSFMQELAHRRSSSSALSMLKITAFVSPYAFHPLELHLTKENLSHFAADLNIPFEINIASIESFDPAEILVLSAGSNEAIAVNLPVGVWQGPSFPTLLRLVKQLLPKIVISMDQGCDRGDLLFSHYLRHALQSCIVLLDSFDAAGTDQDLTNKIERFVLQPRIENCVIGRHCTAEKMLPWRTLFASAGFVPFQFSNFTEAQAECLLKRVQVRGFHVEKRQAALYLYWQRGELASVSAWRC
ncbi:scarecrow-like protein 6 [Dendrobium catenatum]|uniref:Scarecrow-like protein 6 n=1 Tax=Dendrobium catenatum TaxID=906689 RepID=A0A2I0WER5_9ASPA|nr:scarecrow-like protein 6 [Dendrobium catenatum]PKU74135.1 Scarecrow-like protein 6 [Dendrobium catenatum]